MMMMELPCADTDGILVRRSTFDTRHLTLGIIISFSLLLLRWVMATLDVCICTVHTSLPSFLPFVPFGTILSSFSYIESCLQ